MCVCVCVYYILNLKPVKQGKSYSFKSDIKS